MTETKIKIFFSYSHEDEQLCLELQKHLGPLKRADIVSNWYDREIKAGSDWNYSIKENLLNADIILFLISPDFLNSEYIYENEIKQAIEQHNSGVSIVVPIMLRKCDIEFTPFKHIQGLPTDLEPINSKKWFTIDDAMFDIIEGLKKIILKTKERKSIMSSEEVIWEEAKRKNSIDAFLDYLKKSRLKTKFDDAVKNIGSLNSNQVKDFNPSNSDKLEIELLERDRKRVAMELHDNIGSQLTMIRMLLHTLKLEGDTYEQIRLSTEEVISAVRRISRSLLINYNDNEFDLKESILELQSTILKTNKLDFELVMKDFEGINNQQLEINIYRIIQELVSNVIEHSRASNLILSIEKTKELISFSVSDNGKGFNLETKGHGIGLKNISSRVQYYNGKQDITSSENGTTIKIQLPMIGK